MGGPMVEEDYVRQDGGSPGIIAALNKKNRPKGRNISDSTAAIIIRHGHPREVTNKTGL
jgi:hypothetical protein